MSVRKKTLNIKKIFHPVLIFILVVFVLRGSSSGLKAAVMTSSSYKIQSDSVNFGGGYSSSTSYQSESTFGEIATGNSESSTYKIKAGYQQMQEVYLAITSASDVVLSPSIGGVTGGTSNGSTAVTVTTDSPAGYSLTIKASSTPALASDTSNFTDYTPTSSDPDYTFSIAATASEFGFTPEGADIASKYKDNGGSACNTGSNDTADACWNGLSTSAETIATRSSGNHPNGTATTLKFRAQSGSSHLQSEGTYTATTTLTALSL